MSSFSPHAFFSQSKVVVTLITHPQMTNSTSFVITIHQSSITVLSNFAFYLYSSRSPSDYFWKVAF